MTTARLRTTFEALARQIDRGARLVRTWDLKGGVSAQVTAFEIERADGRTERLVVRRHGATDRKRNPHIAADEYRLLEVLAAAGVPAPRPRYVDAAGEIFSVPCVVVEYVEGDRDSAPADAVGFLDQLAAVLAQIHRIDRSTADLTFLPERREIAARSPVGPPGQENRMLLLHGDFWPGNTLWRDGRLVAVVDWEDAAVGDPLADLANARLELFWSRGVEAMDEFTRRYALEAAVDLTDLPHWDLWAHERLSRHIPRWGLDRDTENAMRAAGEAFVARAFEKLSPP